MKTTSRSPSRGAWIEMFLDENPNLRLPSLPLAGSVD